jgi:hypothetical protein
MHATAIWTSPGQRLERNNILVPQAVQKPRSDSALDWYQRRNGSPSSTLNWDVATPTQQTAEAPWARRQESQTQSLMNRGSPTNENCTEPHIHEPFDFLFTITPQAGVDSNHTNFKVFEMSHVSPRVSKQEMLLASRQLWRRAYTQQRFPHQPGKPTNHP